jgi:hypothetical protein
VTSAAPEPAGATSDAGDASADPVAWLVAHEQIRQLASRYAIALDARDLDTLVGLFVDDVRVGRDLVGHDALRASFTEQLRPLGVTILMVGNHVIDVVDADHATGIVSCRAELEIGEQWVVQAIQYHDTYERRAGSWRFVRRRHLLIYGADLLERPIGLPPAPRRGASADLTARPGTVPGALARCLPGAGAARTARVGGARQPNVIGATIRPSRSCTSMRSPRRSLVTIWPTPSIITTRRFHPTGSSRVRASPSGSPTMAASTAAVPIASIGSAPGLGIGVADPGVSTIPGWPAVQVASSTNCTRSASRCRAASDWSDADDPL